MTGAGQVMVLNGAPRSGKSSIVAALQDAADRAWLNLGVDVWRSVTPPGAWPGIGLRPGGERPDLEPLVARLYVALYDSVAAHSRLGLDVVVDVGHHDAYSRPLGILPTVASRLDGLPVLFVGVRCPLDVVLARRDAGQPGREGTYATSQADGTVPGAVVRWQEEVHRPGVYDLELDTSTTTPAECARAIEDHLRDGPPGTAFAELAATATATATAAAAAAAAATSA